MSRFKLTALIIKKIYISSFQSKMFFFKEQSPWDKYVPLKYIFNLSKHSGSLRIAYQNDYKRSQNHWFNTYKREWTPNFTLFFQVPCIHNDIVTS